MKKCVIVGGADIGNYSVVTQRIAPEDTVIYCDCGLRHRSLLGREPDLIVADFDSYENPNLSCETIILPHMKDDTDTAYAVKEALNRGFDEFLLVGVIGGRFDHSMGNIGLLLMLDALDKKASIIDDYSELEIISRQEAAVEDDYAYFSLLSIDGPATGITITGALYPLEDAEIRGDNPYGVSNEVSDGDIARIRVKCGRLLLVKVR